MGVSSQNGEWRVEHDMDGERIAAAGAFLAEALGYPGEPGDLAAGMQAVRETADEAVYAAEIETGGGPIAFLVFTFSLDEATQARQAESVAAMTRAEELSTPGPRLVAEAEVGGWGMLLATTPAGLATLSGNAAAAANVEESNEPPVPAADAEDRARAADALMDALRNANARAGELQRMIDGNSGERTVEERALTLYLLDPGSLAYLTRIMRQLVDEATQG